MIIDTLLSQIETLKTREKQVRAALLHADTRLRHNENETRSVLAGLRDEVHSLQDLKREQTAENGTRYRTMIEKIRALAATALPAGAKVLVITRGDNELVKLPDREGWHFPQTDGGGYAGHYPGASQQAIDHLEVLRTRGAGYLIIPGTATWWLTHYVEFHRHLEARYLRIYSDENCILYGLAEVPVAASAAGESTNGYHGGNGKNGTHSSYARLVEQVHKTIAAIVPENASVLLVSKGDADLVNLGARRGGHFPQADGGVYAGHYPADSAAAIEQLETLRDQGAAYLVLPRTAFWWLTHYEDFRWHLDARYQCIHRDADCIIYALSGRGIIRRLFQRFSFGTGGQS